MQVSATLIAAQQAAREARTRLQMPQQQPAVNFAAALEKTADVGFSSLPLKQAAAPAQAAPVQPQAPAMAGRMGQHINIVI
jgi:hypothetical protein